MKIEIEVLTSEYRTGSGTDKKTGNAFSWARQSGFIQLPGSPYPVEIALRLEPIDGAIQPYKVGKYSLSDDSFWLDGYKNLRITPRLIPLKAG